MILEYLRPTSIQEAINLISRASPVTVPIAGGTSVRQRARVQDMAVVDLQALQLNGIAFTADWVEIGAMTTLNEIGNHAEMPGTIRNAIQLEGTTNTRNQATLGGRLVAYNGRSALITTLMAADAITVWDDVKNEVTLGEWLALPDRKPGKLLVSVKFSPRIELALEVVNRTKLDLPILCVSVARWKSGRVRMAVSGFGKCPQMAFDGPGSDGAEKAVENACRNASDARGTGEYRKAMAVVLARRCLEKLQG